MHSMGQPLVDAVNRFCLAAVIIMCIAKSIYPMLPIRQITKPNAHKKNREIEMFCKQI